MNNQIEHWQCVCGWMDGVPTSTLGKFNVNCDLPPWLIRKGVPGLNRHRQSLLTRIGPCMESSDFVSMTAKAADASLMVHKLKIVSKLG